MDEARRVIERLERIEAMHLAGASAASLLHELRTLLGEADAWLTAEGGSELAADALERCRSALARTTSARPPASKAV